MTTDSTTIALRPAQLRSFLTQTMGAKLPVLITGQPGIGKTEIVVSAAAAAKADIMISHPAVADPTDPKGLPFPSPDGKSAMFLPYGDLNRAMKARRPLVWFLDDLGQATPAVQAAYMQLLLTRAVNEHKLPKQVCFVAATNRRTDRAGVSGILEPVKSRFASIVALETHLDDWVDWAMDAGCHPHVVAFLRMRPDLLCDFKPTQDLTNSPSPRGWFNVSRLCNLMMESGVAAAAYSGAVGTGAATEFTVFADMADRMPDPMVVMKDPASAPIPEEASVLFALTTAMAYMVDGDTVGGAINYAIRLEASGYAEHGAFMVQDIWRRQQNAVLACTAFKTLSKSPLAGLILGDA